MTNVNVTMGAARARLRARDAVVRAALLRGLATTDTREIPFREALAEIYIIRGFPHNVRSRGEREILVRSAVRELLKGVSRTRTPRIVRREADVEYFVQDETARLGRLSVDLT